MTTVQET